jgi:hypothetical protein
VPNKLSLYVVYTEHGAITTGVCAFEDFKGDQPGSQFLRALEARLRDQQAARGSYSARFALLEVPDSAPSYGVHTRITVEGNLWRGPHPEGALYTLDYRAKYYDPETNRRGEYLVETTVHSKTTQVVAW